MTLGERLSNVPQHRHAAPTCFSVDLREWHCKKREGCDYDALAAEALAHVRDALTRDQVERIVYDIAQKMAERGLFVRDDFGEPSIHAIKELSAGLADALHGLLDAAGT